MSTILEFSEERIVLLVKHQKIAINGTHLTLVTMNDQRVSVDGNIISLEYLN